MIENIELTCGSNCAHYDDHNQCCWITGKYKRKSDLCDSFSVEVDEIICSPKKLEALRKDTLKGQSK